MILLRLGFQICMKCFKNRVIWAYGGVFRKIGRSKGDAWWWNAEVIEEILRNTNTR